MKPLLAAALGAAVLAPLSVLAQAPARPATAPAPQTASGAVPAQPPAAARPGGRSPAPGDARAGAPVDLTGQWVSVVTEDWRWRMLTPPKGDYESVPLNAEGRRVADQWNLATDNAAGLQCRAFGAGGITRMPTRVRIAWDDANTLKLETDAGEQTRVFKFIQPAPGNIMPALTAAYPSKGERSWQGDSRAQWFKQFQTRGLGFGGGPGPGGALRVVTRNMRAGYLRKNGVPYSEDAVITEQFDRHDETNGDVWITVTTVVDDPKYLTEPFITSTSFKKEVAPGKWNPTPCRTPPPLEGPLKRSPAAF